MMPRIRSSTVTCVPTWTNIFEPPIRQAVLADRQLVVELAAALLQPVVDQD